MCKYVNILERGYNFEESKDENMKECSFDKYSLSVLKFIWLSELAPVVFASRYKRVEILHRCNLVRGKPKHALKRK